MTRIDISDVVGVLTEPAIVVTPSGKIIAANDAYRAIVLERGGNPDVGQLEEVVVDDPKKVRAYLTACAHTRPFVFGSLTLRDGTRSSQYRCEGGILHASGDPDEVLLLLRFQRASDAVERFTLLNRKIEELHAEVHRRRKAEDELREVQRNLEERVADRTSDLKRANEELRRSNHALEEFAYVASHDLREPLRKITVFSEMLQEEARDHLTEHEASLLRRMYAAADRMDDLIQGLLDYSRISTQGSAFAEVDLNEILDAVLVDLEVAIDRTGATIDKQLLPIIEADELQMRQLFQNLMSNSIKFRREGVAPLVRVSSAPVESNAHRIEVEDNGIGFNAEYAESIFDPFYRLNPRDRFEGTGIGLAICKKIVERHGGMIRAETRDDFGARFIIQLPSARAGQAEQAA